MKRMLFGAEPPSAVQDRPRVILAFDATSSMGEYLPARKLTPEAASDMAANCLQRRDRRGCRLGSRFSVAMINPRSSRASCVSQTSGTTTLESWRVL